MTIWCSFRSGLQTVHLWAGLILSIPFILIGLTGSIIVLVDSLPNLSMPTADAKGEVQSLARVFDAANKVAPTGWTVTTLALPQNPGEPVSAQLDRPRGRRFGGGQNAQGTTLYIDPVSLKILGSTERTRSGSFMRGLTTLHVALLVPDYFGVRIVGFMGIAMTLFGLSGLILWWPRKYHWRSAFGVKKDARGFRLNRDLHSVIGFWSLPVFLVVSISGVDLAFPVTFESVVGAILPFRSALDDDRIDGTGPATLEKDTPLGPDGAVALARSAVPDARVLSVQMPSDFDGMYMVTLAPRPYGDDAPQISAFIGPGAQISDIVDPRTFSLGKRLLVWLRVLHYGQGLGVFWQALVFFSGFLPLLFAVTGLSMWWLKRVQRRAILGAPGNLAPAE